MGYHFFQGGIKIKKFLIVLPLLFLIGCYTTPLVSSTPVSSMSDSELQNEYLDIQYKISFKEAEYFNTPSRVPVPPPTIKSYNTSGSANTYGSTHGSISSGTYSNPYSSTYSGTTYMNTRTTPNYDYSDSTYASLDNLVLDITRDRLKRDINTLRDRLSNLRLELSRRGLYVYP